MTTPGTLSISRVMIFARDARKVAEFYRDKLGLAVRGEIGDGWAELQAGGCDIAIHGGMKKGTKERGPGSMNMKVVFGCRDVAKKRDELIAMGVTMFKLSEFPHETKDLMVQICDGEDPEGNLFQISNRNSL